MHARTHNSAPTGSYKQTTRASCSASAHTADQPEAQALSHKTAAQLPGLRGNTFILRPSGVGHACPALSSPVRATS
eukprot:1287999-Amphidinium_carterae.1